MGRKSVLWISCAIVLSLMAIYVLDSYSVQAAAPKYETVVGEVIDFKYDFVYGYREPRTWALIEPDMDPTKRVCVKLYAKDYYQLVVGDSVKVTYVLDTMQADSVIFVPKEGSSDETQPRDGSESQRAYKQN